MVGQVVVFAIALLLPRSRRAFATSMDGFQTDKVTRRTVVATLAGTAAVVATEFVLSKARGFAAPVLAGQRPK